VIQHPDLPDTPAYKVTVLQPAPTPLPPGSIVTSRLNTPAPSTLPTPRSEPISVDRYLTPEEVAIIFLRSLIASARSYLGKPVTHAVITVPPWFTPSQRSALRKAATETGINVSQLLDEAGAVAAITSTPSWKSTLPPDRLQLLVDVGASSTTVSLLSLRSGLTHILASTTTPSVGGDLIDTLLVKYFASEFTKKTKIPLTVCPATQVQDQRAEAKLRLALEHTKRSISASSGVASCPVESLKDGVDFNGSINRMRFDIVIRSVYALITSSIASLLESINVDPHEVDEIVYVGGSASLPSLDEHIISGGFRDDIETPFTRGIITGGGVGDPTTILARGCASQAHLISEISDPELLATFTSDSGGVEIPATTKALGVLLPNESCHDLGGTWIPIIENETPIPVRRKVCFDVELLASNKITIEVWEVEQSIHIEKVKLPKPVYSDDDEGAGVNTNKQGEEEEEEEEEIKSKQIKKSTFLASIPLTAKHGVTHKGESEMAGRTTTTVEVILVVDLDGGLNVTVFEVGGKGAVESLEI